MYNHSELLADFEAAFQEFEPELRINKLTLDDAIAIQPDIYYRVGQRAAEATSYRDQAKQELANEEAKAAQEIRQERDKNTESAIKEMVTLDRYVAAAHSRFLAWERMMREWQALERAFADRSRMLRDLAQLYASGYFTITSAGRAVDDVRDKRAEYGRERMNQARQARQSTSRRERL